MTALIGAPVGSYAQVGEPSWCTRHYEPSPGEAFHQRTLHRVWSPEGQVMVGLARFDSGGKGAGLVEVGYSEADTEGSVTMSRLEADTLAGAAILAAAMSDQVERRGLALYLRCAYESVMALVAAVKMSRASSPRQPSDQRSSSRSE